jgi:charged multivesicular body protein 2A
VEEEEDEEESDQIVQQVLDEIGISFEQSLPSAGGSGQITTSAQEAKVPASSAIAEGDDDAALQARLDSLRK